MEPNIQMNFMAIIIAVVATFILGFIWYTPLFGKAWAKEMGFDPDMKPSGGAMAKGMIGMIVGNFLLAWVFAHNMAVWNPVTWGLEPNEMTPMSNAIMATVFTYLGFYLPVDFGIVTWQQRSWKLFGIDTGWHFVMLLCNAMILSHMMF